MTDFGQTHKGTGQRRESRSNYHRAVLELTLCSHWVKQFDCLSGGRVNCRKCLKKMEEGDQ